MKNIILFILIPTCSFLAQDFSVGFNYSRLITGKNYVSASLYTLEAEYEFIPNTLSAGFSASGSDTRINKSFIKNPPPDNAYGSFLKIGVQAKYFPFLLKTNSFTLKPYVGIELGVYNGYGIKTYLGMGSNCAEYYFFGRDNGGFYTTLDLGGIIFPEQPLSFVFGLKYQIDRPTIKYKKPNCSEDGQYSIGERTEHTEKVNLDMLLWSIGFKINF